MLYGIKSIYLIWMIPSIYTTYIGATSNAPAMGLKDKAYL